MEDVFIKGSMIAEKQTRDIEILKKLDLFQYFGSHEVLSYCVQMGWMTNLSKTILGVKQTAPIKKRWFILVSDRPLVIIAVLFNQ